MMTSSRKTLHVLIYTLLAIVIIVLLIPGRYNSNDTTEPQTDTIIKVIYDTILNTEIVHDTVFKIRYKTKTKVSYIDTTPLVISNKKSFVYIQDTFNIEDRTYYITEKQDTVKVFYFDYTYYVFKYHIKDTIVAIDSVLGCDLYTHFICDDRERIVIFHTCEGESRTIVNMLNKQGK